MFKKATALILTASILLTTACSSAKPFSLYDTPIKFDDPFAAEPKDVSFSDIEIADVDADAVISSLKHMQELAEKDGSLEELKELYKDVYIDMDKIGTNYSVSSMNADIDAHDQTIQQTKIKYETDYNRVVALYTDTMKAVLKSSYKEEMKKFIGEDVAKIFEEEDFDVERVTELSNKESELTNEYLKLSVTPITAIVNGEEWDVNKLYENMNILSYDEYLDIYLAIDKEFNKKAVEIYIQLVEIRKELTKEYGYDDVAKFYYEKVFNRDFSPEDAGIFHENVKKYIAPVSNSIPTIYNDASVQTEKVLPDIAKILPDISHELAEIFNEMTENGMCILVDDLTKSQDMGYTTAFSSYGRPVIYNALYGDYRSITDTVHEFGHYCDFYLNAIYTPGYSTQCYDLAEVSSTGLEVLFYDHYDTLFGESNDEKAHFLSKILSGVVHGCCFDEAQQKVYNYDGKLTADIVNDIFAETAKEYGMTDEFERYIWAYTSHHFLQPFYYISYATSTIAALEIWTIAQTEGTNKATDCYLNILSEGSFENSYSETIKKNGLKGFADSENLKRIAESVDIEIKKLMK